MKTSFALIRKNSTHYDSCIIAKAQASAMLNEYFREFVRGHELSSIFCFSDAAPEIGDAGSAIFISVFQFGCACAYSPASRE